MTKYIEVEWPETQFFMDNERFSECIPCQVTEEHPNSYMVPEDLYNEVFK